MREADRVRQDFEHLIDEKPMQTELVALQMEMLLDIRELLIDMRDMAIRAVTGEGKLTINPETNQARIRPSFFAGTGRWSISKEATSDEITSGG